MGSAFPKNAEQNGRTKPTCQNAIITMLPHTEMGEQSQLHALSRRRFAITLRRPQRGVADTPSRTEASTYHRNVSQKMQIVPVVEDADLNEALTRAGK